MNARLLVQDIANQLQGGDMVPDYDQAWSLSCPMQLCFGVASVCVPDGEELTFYICNEDLGQATSQQRCHIRLAPGEN